MLAHRLGGSMIDLLVDAGQAKPGYRAWQHRWSVYSSFACRIHAISLVLNSTDVKGRDPDTTTAMERSIAVVADRVRVPCAMCHWSVTSDV
jgi:hypothetical protein